MKMPQPPALTVPESNPMQRNASFLPKPTLCLRSRICSLPLGKGDTREGGKGLTEVAQGAISGQEG